MKGNGRKWKEIEGNERNCKNMKDLKGKLTI